MKLHLIRDLRFEVLGDELVVLDASSGVVHRLSGAARELVQQVRTVGFATVRNDDEVALALVEAGVLVAEGGPLSRRAMLGLATGLGIVTLALPNAAAAASGGPGTTSPPVDGSGVTSTSTSTTTTTLVPQVPATISGMTGSDISGGSGSGAIRLTFTAPADNGSAITSYKVYRTVSGSDSLFQTVSGSTGPLELTGLTRGTSYTFKVAAVNAVGEAAKSNSVTVTPAALVPDQISNLSATAGAGGVTLSFTAPASNGATITSYKVYRTVSGTDSLFTTYSGATGPIEIDMLDPTESYTFKVAAVNSEGEATKSASDSATPTAVATGGTVTYFTGNGTIGADGVKYAVHKFVNDEGGTGSAAAISSSFVLNAARNIDYLVVAAGGSAGSTPNNTDAYGLGGGGAGGVRQGSSVAYTAGTYAVTVAGTRTAPAQGSSDVVGNDGASSSFGAISATGGGGGGEFQGAGRPGGSGGGGGGRGAYDYASYWALGGAGNKGGYSPAEGNGGGRSRNYNSSGRSAGGGGGGAGGAGGDGGDGVSTAGNGGPGITSTITGSSVTYAGGGGGGARDNYVTNETAGTGGSGGGGDGSAPSGNGGAGLNGRGGGGGGVGGAGRGGAGGSGIVVIRYPITKTSY